MRKWLGIIIFLGSSSLLFAQNKAGLTQYRLQKASGEIVIDGILDEPSWEMAEIANGFYMQIPSDTSFSSYESEVRMTFDGENFYFGITCYDKNENHIVQSLRRDWVWDLNENFSIYIDPFGDYTNGFAFGITPYGVQREGTIDDGTEVNADWDNKWYSAVQRYPDRWVAEIAIPFKSIRYNDNIPAWNIQFLRNHLKINERSVWIAVEQQYVPSALTFSGRVIWPEQPPKAGKNISFIPYVLGNFNQNREIGERPQPGFNIGFDAKVSVTPSLNLDLTMNPDFSQVEVDQQVINLSRFEFQFPERRQFFLENSDLFGKFGFPQSRAFFSRRIGIVTDTLGRTEQVPILGGARLSGKIGPKWRLGLLNMLTDKKEELGLPYQNYSVLALQRNVFSRSNIAFTVVNKQNLGVDQERGVDAFRRDVARREVVNGDTISSFKLSNQVVGVEYNLFSEDTRWSGDFYYQKSFDAWTEGSNYNHGAFLRYQRRRYSFTYVHVSIGDGFNAEAGFVPRRGYHNIFFSPRLFFYPKNPSIINYQFALNASATSALNFDVTDREQGGSFEMNFSNTSRIEINAGQVYEKMFFDFNPIQPLGDSSLVTGTDYSWRTIRGLYQSDRRKLFTYDLSSTWGGFYNGQRFNLNGAIAYRYQPYGSLAVTFDYNDLQMPEWLGSARFFLIGPRLDLTFTDKIFLTTFIQYNNRFDNININARFQYRFAPASDMFLVYTENYLPETLFSKNRAMVFKLVYWLNI